MAKALFGLYLAASSFLFSQAVAQTYGPSAYLKESQSGFSNFLGNAIAYDGQRIVASKSRGSVAIFARSQGSWVEEDLIEVADRLDLGSGPSVALSGDTLAVGAPFDDAATAAQPSDNSLQNSGAVYLFTRDGSGNWSQTAYLKAASPAANDEFGISVALDGTTLFVAGTNEVHVLEFVGGAWSTAKSVASGTYNSTQPALAYDGVRLLVGNSTGTSVGALGTVAGSGYVEVYVLDGDSWSLEQSLQASNAGFGDQFGGSVGIKGDRLIVGAREEDSAAIGINGDGSSNAVQDSGAAYVFDFDEAEGVWTETAYLKPGVAGAYDRFGTDVAIDGDLAVVGAPYEDSAASTVNGDSSDDSLDAAGAAWVFKKVDGAWAAGDYLKAPNPGLDNRFGVRVALSGDTIVVTAPRESSSSRVINSGLDLTDASRAGAVYVFTPDGELSEPVPVLPEVEFLQDNPDTITEVTEGDSFSSLPIVIRRTVASGPLTVTFQLAETSDVTPDEFQISGGGPSDPVLTKAGRVYTVVFADGQQQASYRLRALVDPTDEAEALESIVLEFVPSDDYTINSQLGVLRAAIKPQGFLVTNTNESGGGSLRQAIENANAHHDVNVITFSDGSHGSTDFYDGTARTIYASESFVILYGVTIEGPGRDLLAISGNSNGDFVVDPGECRPFILMRDSVITRRPITLRNLTIQDGVTDGSGGLINASGSTIVLTLDNCRLTRGRASDYGGALFAPIPSLTVTNTEISHSQAGSEGGGVYEGLVGYFADVVITGNKARNGGGASSSGYFLRTEISNNTAEDLNASGGGVLGGSDLRFLDCVISGNRAVTVMPDGETPANAGWAQGGGVYVVAALTSAGTHTFVNTTIANNTAEGHMRSAGGGVSYFLDAMPTGAGSSVSGTIRFFNCTISGNVAKSAGALPGVTQVSVGGGIDSISDENYLDFCTVTGNYAETSGSGIYVVNVDETNFHSQIEIYNSIIAGNIGDDVSIGRTTEDRTVYVSRGYNVIGIGTGADQFTAESDQTGIEDPGLGPLADNGGAVPTHALIAGSPALGTGDPNPTVRDFPILGSWEQEIYGSSRTSGGRRDRGAIEFMPSSVASSDIRIESIAVNAAGVVSVRFASEPGKTYFIEYTDDLTDEFIHIESGVTATSALTEFTDPGPPLTPAPLAIAGQRFYRIVEE